jgi:hypothetical protein
MILGYLVLSAIVLPARAQDVLNADIYMLVSCPPIRQDALIRSFVRLAAANGFEVSDQLATPLFQIVARRPDALLDLNRFPTIDGRYSIVLITEPPTRRQTALENAIKEAIIAVEDCRITSVAQHENDASRLPFFRRYMALRSRSR